MEGRNDTRQATETDHVVVGDWKVEKRLATAWVAGRGPAAVARECGGYCCRHGVYISLLERDRILEHAERVKAVMDGSQPKEVDRWFEDETHEDEDFEGGVCIGTALHNEKCAFLDSGGLCVLQKLETDLKLPEGQRLKPFYCRLFPLTTWYGHLEFDDLCNGVRPCCTLAAEGGERPAIDAYAYELKEALGEQGLERFRRMADRLRQTDEGEV